jgi:hypothetical protein
MSASIVPLASDRTVPETEGSDRLPVPVALMLIGATSMACWYVIIAAGKLVAAYLW